MGKELVLIHGWDPRFYSKTLNLDAPEPGVAWSDRIELIDLLKSKYEVRFFDLTGFCGKPEPVKEFYDIEDFSSELNDWISKEKIKPKAIIGYSFGGAVALNYKIHYKTEVPVILISPALSRKESTFSNIGNKSKGLVPSFAREQLKAVYQSIFSKYYRLGSAFIKKSYDHIVRRDTSIDLKQVSQDSVLLIYGSKDTSTPWQNVESLVKKHGVNYVLIGGGHDIGETNGKAIFEEIDKFLK